MTNSCAVRSTMNLIGKKWALLIILELSKGEIKWKRYSILKKNLSGVTARMLSRRLNELAGEKILLKREKKIQNKKLCEYSLSSSGKDILPVIEAMKKWSLNWRAKNNYCSRVNCKECFV